MTNPRYDLKSLVPAEPVGISWEDVMKRIASVLLFLLAVACAGEAWATTWGPTATSFNYYAVDTVAEGGNSYNWRTVNNSAKNIQYGFTLQHDDSFESNDTSSAPTPLSRYWHAGILRFSWSQSCA